jgi:Zn-dependent metalloprotease
MAACVIAGCTMEDAPAAHTQALDGEDSGTDSRTDSEPRADCHPLANAPSGALEALDELQARRRQAGLVPEVETQGASLLSVAQTSDIERIPSFGLDRLLIRRGCRGQLRRIHGTPYLVAATAKGAPGTPHCDAFLSEWGALWGMGASGMALEHQRTKHDDRGGAHCIYRQTYHGVPMNRMRFVVHVDPEGRITGANGEYVVHVEDPPTPSVDSAWARDVAEATAPRLDAEEPELVVHLPGQRGDPRLAWKVVRRNAAGEAWDEALISAVTGDLIHTEPRMYFSHEVQQVWDRAQSTDPEEWIQRYQNHSPPINQQCNPSNPDCQTVRDNQALVSQLWDEEFGRDSFDDAGGTLIARYDHIQSNLPDSCGVAASDLSGGITLWPGVTDLDLICHEHGHNMNASEVLFEDNSPHSGTIVEHFADLHSLWCSQKFGAADWNVWFCESDPDEEGPWVRRKHDDPPALEVVEGGFMGHTQPGPDSWRWFETRPDNGSIHSNAGILNKMAYLLHRTGTESHHGVEVEGLGMETAKWIFYDAVNDHLAPPESDLHDYRDALVCACAYRYGDTSHACEQLDNAWNAVGLWTPDETVPADIGSRPAAAMWGFPFFSGELHLLMTCYKSALNNDIKCRSSNTENGSWGDEVVIAVDGIPAQTDQAVAITPMIVDSSGSTWLYIFYKEDGTSRLKYVRIDPQENVEGPWTFDEEFAATDRGQAAATTSGTNSVMFKKAGKAGIGHVRRSVEPLGTWELGPEPPVLGGTDTDPYLTPSTFMFALTFRQSTGVIGYAFLANDTWFAYEEPPGTGEVLWALPVAPSPSYGHRQYAIGPATEWSYPPPASDQVPTIARGKTGLLLAHKEETSPAIRMHALSAPRFYNDPHPARVWGPSVEQPDTSGTAPLVVATKNLDGSERGITMITRVDGNTIRWRETRGGQ